MYDNGFDYISIENDRLAFNDTTQEVHQTTGTSNIDGAPPLSSSNVILMLMIPLMLFLLIDNYNCDIYKTSTLKFIPL